MSISSDEPVQPHADESGIAAVRARLRSLFGAVLPDAYADLLRREDGVDVDGLFRGPYRGQRP